MKLIRIDDNILKVSTKQLDLPLSKGKLMELGWIIDSYETKDYPPVDWVSAHKCTGEGRYRIWVNLAHTQPILTVQGPVTKLYQGKCKTFRDYLTIKYLIGLP